MIKIDHEKCSKTRSTNMCGQCVDACVNEVLVIEPVGMGGPRVMVKNPDDCEECGDCEMACPCDAITVEEE